MAELHLESAPELDRSLLAADVTSRLSASELLDTTDSPAVLAMFAHRAFLTDFADRKGVPVSTAVLQGQEGPRPDHSRVDLTQTWSFPEAQGRLDLCRHEVLVAEMMGFPRPAIERVAAFRAVVMAVSKCSGP